jgi:hypothetical protein
MLARELERPSGVTTRPLGVAAGDERLGPAEVCPRRGEQAQVGACVYFGDC